MNDYYIGIDIGGTKIAGAIVTSRGKILTRAKMASPVRATPKSILVCLVDLIAELQDALGIKTSQIKGIGLGIPGIVDTDNHHILAAPNINLSGFPLSAHLKKKYRMKIVMTNDVNAGLLGEAWLGAARGLSHVVAIAPGTGVGGAVLINGKLLLGLQGAATELGHMIMQVSGPLCHCGNHGCLEALTSRWAIERDIRALIKSGEKSIVKELNNGSLTTIKSRVLKEALQKNDLVVKTVLKQTATILGQASISINHTFNPQAIVFGGGVIKACGFFMLPIIEKAVKADPFFKGFNTCRIIQSALGDDAVILGAVALVKTSAL
ncbi:MAG: ROK family protein [Candidatus Omnitrophica bacterium]|nr:ROK family protein [Candidatus Omnitrophota bacterium]